MARKTDHFEVPVCNSFQAKVLNDQLCYEVDLNKYANNNNMKKALKSGFRFILDYNEDRQVKTITESMLLNKDDQIDWFDNLNPEAEAEKDNHAFIYLDTIGNKLNVDLYQVINLLFIIRASEVHCWKRRI